MTEPSEADRDREVRRYPLADLVVASGLSEHALVAAVGMSGATLKLARVDGLSLDTADRYAIRLGLHPFTVWPSMAGDILEDATIACAECEMSFTPSRRGQKFCSKACYQRTYQRTYQRRRYAEDAEYRAGKIADSAARYRAEGEYVRAQQRRYDTAKRRRLAGATVVLEAEVSGGDAA